MALTAQEEAKLKVIAAREIKADAEAVIDATFKTDVGEARTTYNGAVAVAKTKADAAKSALEA